MANNYFKFKQFTVMQDQCAMKVGTDGVLIGAWADGGLRILDVGTGTGLIALMMAQRFPHAMVTAVEIDQNAARQAEANITASPFSDRITVVCEDILDFAREESRVGYYDAIVCNPPYFVHSLKNPDERRTLARHADSLPFCQLFSSVVRLMSHHEVFSLIIPADMHTAIERQAKMVGLEISKKVAIRTTPNKLAKRYLYEFVRGTVEDFVVQDCTLETTSGMRSPWYKMLTEDFYL